jgi:IS1 family transposase
MDEQWGYVGAKSRQRWLFYAYDRLRKTVVAHVFGERTMATLGRLLSLLSAFEVRLENGIYGHSRFCNTDFDDKLACLNLSGV